jgi:hypothetical protein
MNAIIVLLVFLGGMSFSIAQTPGVPYQAYIIDTNGGFVPGEQIEVPLVKATVTLQFEIRNDNGEIEYIEQKTLTTDEFGMVSTVIGVGGTPVMGTFEDIDWNGRPKKMYTDIDFSGTGVFQDHTEMDLVYIPGAAAGAIAVTSSTTPPNDGENDPANPIAGDIYIDESTGGIYIYDGTTWTIMAGVSADADNWVKEGSDGLPYLSGAGMIATIESLMGKSSGSGEPTDGDDDPADPQAGDIYVDESTGDTYVYDGTTWTILGGGVSADADNIIIEGTDGLPYLDDAAIQAVATGIFTEVGSPTDNMNDPINPEVGDIYVDETTGDMYTFADTTGDGMGDTWVPQSDVVGAANGLTLNAGTIELGGALTKPTTITTTATNTLAVGGLTATPDTDDYDIVTVDNTTGVLKKIAASNLDVQRYEITHTAANDGDNQFVIPQPITSTAADLASIDVYRNGARIGFTRIDDTTIQLDLDTPGSGCYAGDEIRIVQLQ